MDLSDLNSSYRDDEVVSLRCDVGHVGSLWATCINGEWSIRGRRCQGEYMPAVFLNACVFVCMFV